MKRILPFFGPLLFIAAYLAPLLFFRGKISNPVVFVESIKGLYAAYGYPIVFLGALLEATFLIGFYVPGSTVVLLGVALSKTGIVQFPAVLFLGTLGLNLGYTINYFLGRYGWYQVLALTGLNKAVEGAKGKLLKQQEKTMFLGYFFPGGASIISTAAGILAIPFGKFLALSLLAQGFWGLLWGSLAYFFGIPLVELLIKYFGFVLAGIGAFWVLRRMAKRL